MTKQFYFEQFYFKQFCLALERSLNIKTVLFQVLQFILSKQFSKISPIDRPLSIATTPGQSEPESDGNEGVLHIPQSSNLTGTSPSDYLVSYIRTLVGGSYPST